MAAVKTVSLPMSWRPSRLVAVANVLAVALAMAAAAASGVGIVFRDFNRSAIATLSATMILGAVWAALLRVRATVGNNGVRVGWILSLPLAALNAVAAEVVFALIERGSGGTASLWTAARVGLVNDAVYWLPALVIVLVLFGLPLAWSQRQASKGLSGREGGEGFVGATTALIAAVSMALVPRGAEVTAGGAAIFATASAAIVLGALTSLWSLATRVRRRRFVAQVEAGEVPRFRVDPTPEGKVLVRVNSQGEGYRVGDLDEVVEALDADGEAIRGKV
jgi:hypothetical protein